MSKIKRLFFDIETSPNIGMFWSAGYKQSIGYDNIIKERAIICISYKWAGDKTVHALTWDKEQNDKTLLEKFMKVADTADELVAHNGDRFDLPWIRTRCLYHRIPIFPVYTTLDTLKGARSKFRFNSNKLDYIAQFLNIGAKIHTDYGLWKGIVLNNSRKDLQKMVVYCKNDVVILEKVYNEMSPYLPAKVHHGVANGSSKCSCSNCGSEDTIIRKRRIMASGSKVIQLQCKKCGKYTSVSESVYQNERNKEQ
jgi:uncharacterized protein YprB with RNaseH-like and TPR domain